MNYKKGRHFSGHPVLVLQPLLFITLLLIRNSRQKQKIHQQTLQALKPNRNYNAILVK